MPQQSENLCSAPPLRNVPELPQSPLLSRRTNRVGIALAHSTKFAFESQARLAERVGVSRSTINRLVRGLSRPSFALAQAVTDALSEDIGVPLQPSDLFSENGSFDEPSGCTVFGCSGCHPEHYFDVKGNLKPAYRGKRPGDWSIAPAVP